MKRFAIAAALATVLGLGLAGTADAQYVQRYYIAPNGNIATTTQWYNPWGYQTYNTLTSPLGAVKQQMYYGDVFGNTYGRAYGYNPLTGLQYNRGFYTPSPALYPYVGGYNYNFYRRW